MCDDDFPLHLSLLGGDGERVPAYVKMHYENMPMQYTEVFKVVKNENFQWKILDTFLIFAQNIDCGYT